MSADATNLPGEDDPILRACLDDAIAPLVGLLPPEDIAELRHLDFLFLTTHPVGRRLFERLQDRTAKEGGKSGEERVNTPEQTADTRERVRRRLARGAR